MMTWIGFLTGLVTLFGAGFGITMLLLRGRARLHIAECLCLSWLFGTGAVSLLLWIAGGVTNGLPLQGLITAAALVSGFAGVKIARTHPKQLAFALILEPIEWILLAFLIAQIVIIFYVSAKHTLGWDGLLVWELKARYAFFDGGKMPGLYYTSAARGFSHAEYPLFLPFTELWLYLWMGEPNQFWVKFIFPIFYAVGAVLLAIVGARLSGARWIGLAVANLLFFVPDLTGSPGGAIVGYADYPLATCYLVVIGYLLSTVMLKEVVWFRIYLLGLLLLPWIKREGAILWVIGSLLGVLVIVTRRMSWWRSLLLTPGLLLILAWRSYLHAMKAATPQDFLPVSLTTVGAHATRLTVICHEVLVEIRHFKHWSYFWVMVGVALVSLVVRRHHRASLIILGAIVLPVVAYASTYIFSSWPDLTDHIRSSLPRLLLQLLPVGWLAVALAIRRAADPIGAASDKSD